MTVAPSIGPARFIDDHLEQASPDLLRHMLTTFINTTQNHRRVNTLGIAWRLSLGPR